MWRKSRQKERFEGRYSSGQRGQTVNLLVFTFAGSNPALPTNEVEILKLKAGVAQLVERQPSKLNVAGSNPVSRSNISRCSSGVERFLGKEEVTGSNPVIGSMRELKMIREPFLKVDRKLYTNIN